MMPQTSLGSSLPSGYQELLPAIAQAVLQTPQAATHLPLAAVGDLHLTTEQLLHALQMQENSSNSFSAR